MTLPAFRRRSEFVATRKHNPHKLTERVPLSFRGERPRETLVTLCFGTSVKEYPLVPSSFSAKKTKDRRRKRKGERDPFNRTTVPVSLLFVRIGLYT